MVKLLPVIDFNSLPFSQIKVLSANPVTFPILSYVMLSLLYFTNFSLF